MSQPDIYIERDAATPAIAAIVINRPRARNAITQAMWHALPDLVAAIAADDSIRVAVVRGVDHTAFAAGADIAEFAAVYGTPESAAASSAAIDRALAALEALPKPSIAEIRGVCVGGGVSLALACDLRFADPNARFAVTPGKLGLAYSLADTRRLVAAVGVSRSKDLLFSGRLIDAPEALAAGLVDRVMPADTLADAIRSYAAGIANLAPGSHEATKQTLRLLATGAADDDMRAHQIFLDRFASTDFHEGYAAFLGKRAPKY